jgi:hypothetical protein
LAAFRKNIELKLSGESQVGRDKYMHDSFANGKLIEPSPDGVAPVTRQADGQTNRDDGL